MALRLLCCGVFCVSLLLVNRQEARAVVLLHDQFLEDGVLATKVPMPGPGAAWNPGSATGVNAVSVVSGEVSLLQTETINGEDIANVFGDQSASGTTFAGFDFRLPSADNTTLATDADIIAEGLFFVTLRGTSASTTQRARTGFVPPAADGDYRMAINADNGNLVAGASFPTDLNFDTTYRAVISFDASNGKSKLWLDPENESSTNVEHTGTGSTTIGTVINRILLRQNNSYNGIQLVDNVIAATTFAEALSGTDTGLDGDYNEDGSVDAADYVVWRKFDGSTAGYNLWRDNFGSGGMSGSGNGAITGVPEPATALLAVMSLVLLSGTRRRTATSS